jgi:hypothetical protein
MQWLIDDKGKISLTLILAGNPPRGHRGKSYASQLFGAIAALRQEICKLGVDCARSAPYRPAHRSEAALEKDGIAVVASKVGQQSPGSNIGVPLLSASFVVWLFDIVGFR